MDNVALHQGEMESLPLPDASGDVVISNGPTNPSARRSRVLAEAYRVLRPGGRLCVGDLTIREEELSLADVAEIALFTPDLIELMDDLLPPERQAEVAMAVTVSARKPR